jgi:mRNA-degrading endonuclease RelE of RelBE toxin-antitoxin system
MLTEVRHLILKVTRKRTGDYRIIFSPHREQRVVDIGWVVLKSEKTYN